MSMLFVNRQDKEVVFSINNRGWRRIFLLGLMFGWEPQGTSAPAGWLAGRSWDSKNYATNDGQVVTAADALALADAIESAIPLLKPADPDQDKQSSSMLWELELFRRFEQAMAEGSRDPGCLFFDTRWTDKLNELAAFCRKGAFKIC